MRRDVLKTITANATRVEISVNDDGIFSAHVNGEYITAETLADVVARVRKATKKAKVVVAVPVSVVGYQFSMPKYGRASWISGSGVRHVTLTGFDVHGDVRYRDERIADEHGDLDRLHRGGTRDIVRRLTDDEAATYTKLSKAKDAASTALWDFLKAREVNAKELVKAAIAAKVDTPVEPDDETEDPR